MWPTPKFEFDTEKRLMSVSSFLFIYFSTSVVVGTPHGLHLSHHVVELSARLIASGIISRHPCCALLYLRSQRPPSFTPAAANRKLDKKVHELPLEYAEVRPKDLSS